MSHDVSRCIESSRKMFGKKNTENCLITCFVVCKKKFESRLTEKSRMIQNVRYGNVNFHLHDQGPML
jgi:hypothetical protein